MMMRWDLVTALALIWTAIATPVEVAFLAPSLTALDALFLINRLIDLIFVLVRRAAPCTARSRGLR